MLPIQYVLLAFILLSLILLFWGRRRQLLIRLFLLFHFMTGGLFVLFPELSTKVAARLGVGRGTDLILYVLVVLFYLACFLCLGKIRDIEQKQTEILREIALLNNPRKNNSAGSVRALQGEEKA